MNLTKFDDLRVVGASGSDRREVVERLADAGGEQRVDYVVDGDVRLAGNVAKFGVRLIATADNAHLWGDSFRFDIGRDDLFDVQEKIVGRIASIVGGEYGQINQSRYEALQQAFQPRRVGLIVAGLEVPHVHIHVLPFERESDLAFRNAAPSVPPGELALAAEAIRGALRAAGHTAAEG